MVELRPVRQMDVQQLRKAWRCGERRSEAEIGRREGRVRGQPGKACRLLVVHFERGRSAAPAESVGPASRHGWKEARSDVRVRKWNCVGR